MGVIELFVYIAVVVMIGWVCVWGLGQLAPGHPGIIDNIIWFLVVLMIIFAVADATGLVGRDPQIPRLR